MGIEELIVRGGRTGPTTSETLLNIEKVKQGRRSLDIQKDSLQLKREALLQEMDIYRDKKNRENIRKKIVSTATEQYPTDPAKATEVISTAALASGDLELAQEAKDLNKEYSNILPPGTIPYFDPESIKEFEKTGKSSSLKVRDSILNPKTSQEQISSDKLLAGWMQQYVEDPAQLTEAQIDAVEKKFFRGEESTMKLASFLISNNIEAMRSIITAKTPEEIAEVAKNIATFAEAFKANLDSKKIELSPQEEKVYVGALKWERAGNVLTEADMKKNNIDAEKYNKWKLTR